MEHNKKSPKDFFLYLLSSVSLYYCAVWLITLYYQYINHLYPEIARNQYYYDSQALPTLMRWAIASLIIVFPVYIWVTRYLNKDTDKHPEKRELRIRKWLIYVTLFLAAVTIIVDLVALVFNLLEGDFTARFLLKVFSVFLVAGMVFGYYYYELRRDAGQKAPERVYFRWGAIALVTVSIIGAFFIVGSPAKNRARQYDNQRISDLQSVQWQVVNYWQQKNKLPTTLVDTQDDLSGWRAPLDPETRAAYEYQAKSNLTFELCATFGLSDEEAGYGPNGSMARPMYDGGLKAADNWAHDAGRSCFERTIDPDFYPPRKPAPAL
jgi:hypothetical protein